MSEVIIHNTHSKPFVVTIPSGQWSGSNNDYYITVNASNVTANSILVPNYDADSAPLINGTIWCVPSEGSFTIHTDVIPNGTVTILVQFPGTMGEADYQVLAPVYSTSQTYSKSEVDDIIDEITPEDIGAVSTSAVIDISHGGTGVATAAVSITNAYSSALDVINAVKERAFPISIQKNGQASYSDIPTGYEGHEWNMVLVGNKSRLTAFLFLYGQTNVYKRDFFSGSWLTGWTTIMPITPTDIGAVDKAGDTMTGALTAAGGLTANGIATYDPIFPAINFRNASLSERAHIRVGANDNGIAIRLYSPNAAVYGTVYEDYVLPLPTAESSAVYDILTSKAPVTIEQGGTEATTKEDARVNLGIRGGSVGLTFNNNGEIAIPFSTFGLNSRPDCIVITPSNANVLIRYDFDVSLNYIVLYAIQLDGTPYTGNVRVSILIIA